MNKTSLQVILTMQTRQKEQRAIRKRKVKAPASLSSSTISKAPSFQFRNTSFQNGYSLPIPKKTKFEYSSNNTFNNRLNNPFRFTRMPKSTSTCMGCGEQGHWRKNCPESSTAQQNRLNWKVKFHIIILIPISN